MNPLDNFMAKSCFIYITWTFAFLLFFFNTSYFYERTVIGTSVLTEDVSGVQGQCLVVSPQGALISTAALAPVAAQF